MDWISRQALFWMAMTIMTTGFCAIANSVTSCHKSTHIPEHDQQTISEIWSRQQELNLGPTAWKNIYQYFGNSFSNQSIVC